MHALKRIGNVYLYEELIGQLVQDSQGFHFYYDENYQGISISLSLPISQRAFHSEQLFPYFASLVPEGWLKERYSTLQKIDENDLFGLLLNNGKNLLGATQIFEVK